MKENPTIKEITTILNKNNNILLEWATGTGKTKASIDACNSLNINTILIVVAEKIHIENWETEINKWKFNNNITYKIICYASLHKELHNNYDIIIYDEAHHLASNLRKSYFKSIKSKYKILLSATINKELILDLQTLLKENIITIKYSIDEAFKDKTLPEPTIYIKELILDDTNKTIVKGRKRYTPKEYYNSLTNKIEELKRKYIKTLKPIIKIALLRAGNARKHFLATQKTIEAYKLIKSLKQNNTRFICFCNSIEQQQLLSKDLGIVNSKAFANNKTIESFNNHEINQLFAVNMLVEGQNLVDIEAGVIIQLDKNSRTFIQKLGRTLRSKNPIQYILYFKDTSDEVFLNNAIKEINKKYIKFI